MSSQVSSATLPAKQSGELSLQTKGRQLFIRSVREELMKPKYKERQMKPLSFPEMWKMLSALERQRYYKLADQGIQSMEVDISAFLV
jgi:hypothetical protein